MRKPGMISEFSSAVINEIGFYIYMLIEPRSGNTSNAVKGNSVV